MERTRTLILLVSRLLFISSMGVVIFMLSYHWPDQSLIGFLALPSVFATCLAVAEISSSHGLQSASSVLRRFFASCAAVCIGASSRSRRRALITEGTPVFRLYPTFFTLVANLSGVERNPWAECYKSTPNADIVGSGVRWSTYVLLLFVFVSLSVASLHRQQSGTKELGCAVLISTCLLPEFIEHELMPRRSLRDEL